MAVGLTQHIALDHSSVYRTIYTTSSTNLCNLKQHTLKLLR